MSATASIGGLISGIDTNSILDQLSQAAEAPIRRLEARKAELQDKLVAWSQLEASLLSFRTTASQLAEPSTFDAKTAAASRSDLVSVSASSSAVAGTYTFTVQQLAQTHQMISAGAADTSETEFSEGTVSISVGGEDPLVIETQGLTLTELRDAINSAGAGVTAAIINDGGESSPYHLILSSETSGLAGEMTVTTTGGAPAFSELQAAQDAELVLGSGAGAVTIQSGSNTVTEAIPGLTIELLKADSGAPVSVTVARDTAGIQSQVEDFVEAYNDLVSFFTEQFDYNPDTNVSGTLFADYRLQSLQEELAAAITSEVVGVGAGPRALSDVGVRTLSTGELSVDSAALSAALLQDPDQVARVLAAVGTADDPEVTYLTSTEHTRPSGSTGWTVDITQAATRARVTAGVAQTGVLAADETLTIQGVAISLTAGMTQAEVIEEINAHQSETGVTARATDANGEGAGNYLTLEREAYGSAYHITAVSTVSNQGGVETSGLGNVEVTDAQPSGESGTGTGAEGLDVAGTIGGWEATGQGRILTGSEGDAQGLALMVTADAAGEYGKVVFTVGAAQAAFRAALSATDLTTGTITSAQAAINDSISDADEEIARLQATIAAEQERIRSAFMRMEEALGRLQNQSQFLSRYIGQMQTGAAAKE